MNAARKQTDRAESKSGTIDAFEQRDERESDVAVIHAAVYREKIDPKEGSQPVPIWLILSSFALLMWGGWYLGSHSANFEMDRYEGPAAFEYESSGGEPAAPVVIDPMLMGKRIYNNCRSCHQEDGEGIAGKYPPLDGSEWVSGREDNLARILLHGLAGPIQVKGKTYEGNMPMWSQLDDRSLASVLTYIRGSWSNNSPPVSTELVTAVRQATRDRRTAWTAADLEAAPLIVAETPDDSTGEAQESGTSEDDAGETGND